MGRSVALLVVGALAFAACGSSGDGSESTTVALTSSGPVIAESVDVDAAATDAGVGGDVDAVLARYDAAGLIDGILFGLDRGYTVGVVWAAAVDQRLNGDGTIQGEQPTEPAGQIISSGGSDEESLAGVLDVSLIVGQVRGQVLGPVVGPIRSVEAASVRAMPAQGVGGLPLPIDVLRQRLNEAPEQVVRAIAVMAEFGYSGEQIVVMLIVGIEDIALQGVAGGISGLAPGCPVIVAGAELYTPAAGYTDLTGGPCDYAGISGRVVESVDVGSAPSTEATGETAGEATGDSVAEPAAGDVDFCRLLATGDTEYAETFFDEQGVGNEARAAIAAGDLNGYFALLIPHAPTDIAGPLGAAAASPFTLEDALEASVVGIDPDAEVNPAVAPYVEALVAIDEWTLGNCGVPFLTSPDD